MTRIPKILHYCFGLTPNDKPWSLVHYVCVKSAIERIKPEKAFLYYEYEPSGPWWELTKPLLQTVKIDAPKQIFGKPLKHPAHRADVIRLEKLKQYGGIYLDVDVFVHRGFDDLLGHSVVLGQEGIAEGVGLIGLGNAVVLAECDAPFIARWYEEYRSFRSEGRDEYWNEHSIKMPAKLARQFPHEVQVLPCSAFYWPYATWEHLKWIYEPGQAPVPEGGYANHLWETGAWDFFLANLTVRQVRNKKTNFHEWIKPLVAELSDSFGEPSIARRICADARRLKKRVGRRKAEIARNWAILRNGVTKNDAV